MATINLKGPGLNNFFAERLVKEHGPDGAREKCCGEMLAAVERVIARTGPKREERRMLNLKDPAKCAEWVYGQPMAPCPACGSYNMKPQMPIALETTGDETMPQLVGKWARATKAGATPLQGPAYYMCWDCHHKGPAVDCTGRTIEECRADRALNAEMKRLWNAQTPNA